MDSVFPGKSHAAELSDVSIEKFENLLLIATELKSERLKFWCCCKDWCDVSEQAGVYITQVERELLQLNHTTNCVSLGGVSTAIVGTLMGIAGITFALPTAGTSLMLTVGGTSAAAVGGGLSIGSHIIKTRLSRSLCEKAKGAFDKTTELTEELEKQRSAYFYALFKFKDSVEKLTEAELQVTCFQLAEWSSLNELQFHERTKNSLHPTVNRMRAIVPVKTASTEQKILRIVWDIITAISEDPLARKLLNLFEKSDVLQKMLPSIDFRNAFRSTEEGAKLIFQSSFAVYKLVKDSKTTIKTALKGMSKTVRVGIGFLNVLFLAWGMFDLVTTSINVHRGSKSDETEQLSEIAKEVKEYRQEVVRVLKDVFDWDFSEKISF